MLDERTRDRIGGICGIATLVLFGAGWAAWASPGLPNMNSAAAVSHWFVQHQNACRIAAILGCLSLAPMVWFEVCLYARLRRAEGGDGTVSRVMFGAFLVTVVFDMLFCQFLFVAAWRPGHTLPDVTQSLNDIFLGPGVAAFGCWMAAFVSIGLIVLKRGGLPRWLGHTALAVAAAQLLYLPTSFVHGGTFDISNGLFGVFIPLGTPLLWGAAAGVVMLAATRAPERESELVAPRGSQRLGEPSAV